MSLTEKDEELLSLLCRFGNMYSKDAHYVYGSKSYSQKRLTRLANRGYINRGGGYIRIGSKGRESMGGKVEVINEPHYRDRLKLRSSMMARLELALSNWEFVSSTEYARSKDDSSYFMMLGMLRSKSGESYVVYYLHKDVSMRELSRIEKEISMMVELGYGNVLYVLEDLATREYLDKSYKVNLQAIRHCYFFNDEEGYALINAMCNVDILELSLGMLERIVGMEIVPDAGSGYDGYIDRSGSKCMVCGLVIGDLRRELDLSGRINILKNRIASDYIPTTIVCLESLSEYYSKRWPGENIVPIRQESFRSCISEKLKELEVT